MKGSRFGHVIYIAFLMITIYETEIIPWLYSCSVNICVWFNDLIWNILLVKPIEAYVLDNKE